MATSSTAQTQAVSSSDFVKKLFKMLEDTSYQHVVRWSDMGDSFIVLDNNEFTKSVLPRHFKHSNFASFVRQLNKYDFHKVRNNEEGGVNPYGDGTWEFKHRDFQIHNKDLLENIKRKAPATKKPPPGPADAATSQLNLMQIQIDNLTRNQDNLNKNLQGLNRQYQSVVSKLVNFQHTISAHDNFMQNIIQYMANPEPSRELFLAPAQAQKLISSYDEAAKASVDIMNELSQMGAHMAMAAQGSAAGALPPPPQQQSHPTYAPTISSSYSGTPEVVKAEYQSPTRDTFTSPATSPDSQSLPNGSAPIEPSSVFNNFQFPTTDQPSGDSQHTGGLRVFTTGYFAPRQDDDQLESENNNPVAQPPPNMPIVKEHDEEGPPQQSLRVRRQTFVPGWAVPPKILLVDDDAVIRNLSSKFLQVFGCEADIAVDGLSALDKVNMEKYDLILMDVVMPNLDGITTTNYIRQYDTKTPIISMTSNTFPDDILNYRNSGMSDILPKPFTKDSLLGMLEKHLTHMKHMQELGGYVIPAPIKSDRLVELPEQQNPTSQQPQQQQQKQQRQQQQESMPLGTPLDEERPFQFSYDQDYSAIFGNGSTPTQLPPQQQNIPASTGKRRTVSERDQYEYVEQGRSVPRSTGGGGSAPGKRVRYNTPPW